MNLRTAVLVAAATTLALGAVAPATAAPKKKKVAPPVCNLVLDDKGDVPAPDGALDVVSADVASDGRKITGVIRLAGDPDGTSPTSPTGRTYNLQFSGQSATREVFLGFLYSPTAQAGTYGYHDEATGINNGLGTSTVKIVGNDLYMTVPVSVFAEYGKFKVGNRITGFSVTTGRMVGAYASSTAYAYNSLAGDTASGAKAYTVGARSCVKVGGP